MLTISETFNPDWKPDWATIPPNMNYVGIDQSGFVFLYEQRPRRKISYYTKVYSQSSLYGVVSKDIIDKEIYASSQTLFERPGLNNIKKPKNKKR